MNEEQKEQLYDYLRERLCRQIYTDYHIHKLIDILPMLISYEMKDIFRELKIMAEGYLQILEKEQKQ